MRLQLHRLIGSNWFLVFSFLHFPFMSCHCPFISFSVIFLSYIHWLERWPQTTLFEFKKLIPGHLDFHAFELTVFAGFDVFVVFLGCFQGVAKVVVSYFPLMSSHLLLFPFN